MQDDTYDDGFYHQAFGDPDPDDSFDDGEGRVWLSRR